MWSAKPKELPTPGLECTTTNTKGKRHEYLEPKLWDTGPKT